MHSMCSYHGRVMAIRSGGGNFVERDVRGDGPVAAYLDLGDERPTKRAEVWFGPPPLPNDRLPRPAQPGTRAARPGARAETSRGPAASPDDERTGVR